MMRNLFLSLLLANLLILAWQFWVDAPAGPGPGGGELALFVRDPVLASDAAVPQAPAEAVPGGAPLAAGSCFRLGPLPDSTAAQQAARGLASRGIDATPIARDAQIWLGHWVQVGGFDSAAAAEAARERLAAGGIADALVMQDGAQPMLSLGVFRDRNGAERVVNAAQRLGFAANTRDRFRPGVEQWLLIRPRPGQALRPADLRLAGDRILRAELAACEGAGDNVSPAEAGLPADVALPAGL